jgi:hypothetical protein
MAGWWKLVVTGTPHDALSDADLRTIGRLVSEGYSEGRVQ